ncbi:hypothetical protein V493_02003 [Pseudogymnoascus sp. VKM F-4281 (FW-2241)]|nr:hypothetical protein V493_02003 [Pseudogymnoascus sp. VKM F-4281 (FW-2241)]
MAKFATPIGDMEAGLQGDISEAIPLEWDGLDDIANPKNWSLGKRLFNTILPALFAFLITFTTSTYVPGIPLVMVEFHVSQSVATLGLALYTFAIALGPLISAPLSELLGRKPVYLVTMGMLLAFVGGAGGAQNLQTLLICRFLAGVFGSGAVAIGAGTVADLWDMATHGGPASLGFIMGPYLGPVLGYIAGAYVIAGQNNDWRWSAWIVLIVGAPFFVLAFFLSETSKQHILERRHKKSGKYTQSNANATESFLKDLRTAIVRPLHMMFTEPIVAYVSIYTGFTFAMIFSFFGSYSYVFAVVYHFNAREVGLAFTGILPGFLLAIAVFGAFDKTIYAKARDAANGKPAPEHRLYAAMLGSLLMPIGLFWFAWSARESVHWIVPVLSGIPFGCGMLAIFLSSTTYLMDVYRSSTGASALAANGILRYTFGGAFPLFTIPMYEALGIGYAGSVFAFVSVLLLPVPWVFFKYGKALRGRSGYDTI